MAVSESRRQTGPGRLLDGPGAALEASVEPSRQAAAEQAWRRHVRALAQGLGGGFESGALGVRRFAGGLSLGVGAPPDALYTAAALNETAWALAEAELEGAKPSDPPGDPAEAFAQALQALRDEREAEANPVLVALAEAAEARGVELLWDDERLTLGAGAGGQTWPLGALPEPSALDWGALRGIPLALITGTNGKSTTARLLAAMARAAGYTPGLSTTDYVAVGDETVERGDFSGPMGARAALRDRRVTLGVLEVARGGLLRRGVPVRYAAAAAVTNVAADHLGEYGIETLPQLAEAKFVVAKGVARGGALVLSADDGPSVAEALRQAESLQARGVGLVWTSLDPEGGLVREASLAASVVDGHFALGRGGVWTTLVPVGEAPATLGGAALHNVRNALAALALGAALGLPDEALAQGLRAFRGDSRDNPGRANRFDVGGAEVIVDYGHNAHGMAALAALARARPARRRLVLLSSAGDRPDADLQAMAEAVRPLGADRYLLADLPDYLRGRAPGEVPAVFTRALGALGVSPEACAPFPDPAAAVREALAWAREGDGLLLFVLSHRDEALAAIHEATGYGSQAGGKERDG